MDIKKLIDEYTSWLNKEITFEQVGEYYEITTPYLDNANDYLQIYVKQDGNDIFFTDDGATLQGLKAAGFQLTPNRKNYLQKILTRYGIQLKGNELSAKAPVKIFAQKKHMFIQALIRIDDMFSVTKPRVSSFFMDDIQSFFESREIYSIENVQFTGISGFSHNYDFVLQRNKYRPERLCQAVNNPNRSTMGNILFAWNDTKPIRKDDSQLIVILNDQKGISKGVVEGFLNYDAKVIKWSEREKEENLLLLSAS